jgi:GYF domain 2
MSSQWHYSKDGSQHGPVTSQRLKELAASGELAPNDLVWKEGLADWRPAMSLKGLFSEPVAKPSGPPPLPTAKPDAQSPHPAVAGLDAASVATPPSDQPTEQRKPDFFDRARDLTLKAKAKAEAFQKEVQARAERMQQEARANPSAPQAAMMRGAKAAADYARSDEVKELARKARDTVKGGAIAATALAGTASAEGRDRVRKASEQPLIVGAALLCFFPLGLFLVWHHPHWTPTRKLAWTGAWLGMFFLIMVPALVAPRGIPGGVPASYLPTVGGDQTNSQPSDRSRAVSGVPERSRGHLPDAPQTDSKFHWLCLASIRIPGRRSLFFPDVSAGCYSVAGGVGRVFLACSTR